MPIERPTNSTPPRRVAVSRGRLVASILLGVVLANPARAGAAELECQSFVPEAGATGVSTWGGYDVWILEHEGGEVRFDSPGEGVWLDAGAEVDWVHKCGVSEEPTPEATPQPAVEAPAPEDPAPEATPEPATDEPTPEPATDEPTPEPVDNPAPEVILEGDEPPSSDQSTPEPSVTPAPEPSPAPIILRSPPAPLTAPAEPDAPAIDEPTRRTEPLRVGDAEVLGIQLARTGADRAMTLAAIGVALLGGGMACVGVSGRLARQG